MQAIARLNEQCGGRLGQMMRTVRVTAKDPAEASTVPIYCEDPRLSLHAPGLRYLALKMPDHVPVLDKDD